VQGSSLYIFSGLKFVLAGKPLSAYRQHIEAGI
jgi:hypothetical protein